MHAIIRCGKGEYYLSTVFGYFCNITATDNHQKYLERIHNQYYLVLDKDKKKLIKQYTFNKASKYLDLSILIVESNNEGWELDENGYGCVKFLCDVNQDTIEDELPDHLLTKCINIDSDYKYEQFQEIRTLVDIENLMTVSGGFHDAFIVEHKQNDDGSLYLLFDGTWGCKIEVWFDGNVSYSIASRIGDECDPYWFGSTVLIDDGYVYFMDGKDMSISDIGDDYCWFKAKHMKYHVIPNE